MIAMERYFDDLKPGERFRSKGVTAARGWRTDRREWCLDL